MVSQRNQSTTKPWLTVIDLMIVIVLVAIVAAIVFPIFMDAPHGRPMTPAHAPTQSLRRA